MAISDIVVYLVDYFKSTNIDAIIEKMKQNHKIMPRGGYRENAGRKKKWKHGETTSIRVPVALADQILEMAHKLDEGFTIQDQTFVIKDYAVNLSGIPLISFNGKKGILLVELLKAGYEIKPFALSNSIRNELSLT